MSDAEYTSLLDARRAAHAASESTAVNLDGGPRLVVVPFSHLGGLNDLWLIRQGRDGAIGPPSFLGVSPPSVGRGNGPQLVRATVQRGRLTLRELGRDGETVSIALSEIDRDADGDGLTDLVERRLRLDPSSSDTDGDTLDDAHDLAPNASESTPRDENDLIALEIVRATFETEDRPPGSLVVVHHHRSLEWRAPDAPAITLPVTLGETPRDLRDACNVRMKPVEGPVGDVQSSLGPSDSTTRDWEVSHFKSGCGSRRTYRMRLTSEGWTVQGRRADVFF